MSDTKPTIEERIDAAFPTHEERILAYKALTKNMLEANKAGINYTGKLAICEDDGKVFAYVVVPAEMQRLINTPERTAELQRRVREGRQGFGQGV